MPIKIVECPYSPMIEAPSKWKYGIDLLRTCVTLYRSEKTNKHFFYMMADPGGFDNYVWIKCSLADIKLDEEEKILHFYTKNNSHYAFAIGWNYDELKEYMDSLRR